MDLAGTYTSHSFISFLLQLLNLLNKTIKVTFAEQSNFYHTLVQEMYQEDPLQYLLLKLLLYILQIKIIYHLTYNDISQCA